VRTLHTTFLVFFFLSLVVPVSKSHAQEPERIAWNRLQDGKWEKSLRLLQKSLRKNPGNLKANYVLANWFFTQANPGFQIDSAFRYVNKSILNYDTLTIREKERVLKFPIDSLILHKLLTGIDSAAFERAKKENTEAGYQLFITDFPAAIQVSGAIELRDEVSFLESMKINTYQSYHAYLQRYPQSHRAGDATERYEKLLFEDKTKSKRLSGFKSFVAEYPASPYAAEAHRQIFEISTASGEPEDFFRFLKEYPLARYEKITSDILFHIYKEREEVMPAAILNDSLKHVMQLDARFWIPFLKNGVFGFMDQTGSELLPAQFKEVRDDYKCGPVVADILSLPDGYFSRTGKKIAHHDSDLKSIGAGFLTIQVGGCLKLIHKSGLPVISDCYEEYKMVDDNFIAARRNGYYTLFTLAGRILPLSSLTRVQVAEGLILLTRSGKTIVNTIKQLAGMADGNSFQDEMVFDEVLAMDNNLVLVRNSGMEGILNTHLNYVVPLARHTFTKAPFGFLETDNGKIKVHGLSEDFEKNTYDNIAYHRNWLVLTNAQKINLFDIPTGKLVEADADSVWFDRSLTFVRKNTSSKVYLSATHSLDLQLDSRIHFIPSRDSVQFFFTDSKKKRTVFTLEKGEQVFSTDLELVESLGNDYFMVSKGAKKGVLDRKGKLVVPVEMDAIILTDRNHLSLLKNRKFGMYDLQSKKYFKPVYERNMIPLNKEIMVVYKDGFYGLIKVDSKPVTGFEFSEVQAWSDSLIWVKKNFQWILLNYSTKESIIDRVRDFVWIKNTDDEKIMKIHRENYYGIVSNRKGILVQPAFTDITNHGTSEDAFYFTEKHVEEAGIFVVVYFDKNGKLVRRQAYEEDEYERILCEDH